MQTTAVAKTKAQLVAQRLSILILGFEVRWIGIGSTKTLEGCCNPLRTRCYAKRHTTHRKGAVCIRLGLNRNQCYQQIIKYFFLIFHSVISSIPVPWPDSHKSCFLHLLLYHCPHAGYFFILTLLVISFLPSCCQWDSPQHWRRHSFPSLRYGRKRSYRKPSVFLVSLEWRHWFDRFRGSRSCPVQNTFPEISAGIF